MVCFATQCATWKDASSVLLLIPVGYRMQISEDMSALSRPCSSEFDIAKPNPNSVLWGIGSPEQY